VIKRKEEVTGEEGGIAILYGNLAPQGAVVKQSAVAKEALRFKGTARVFDHEEGAMKAIMDKDIRPGSVVVIRYEGPQGGPGMREMLSPTAALAGMGMDTQGGSYEIREPIGNRRVIAWIIIAVSVVVLGVGSIWIYMSFMRENVSDTGEPTDFSSPDDGDVIPPVDTSSNGNAQITQPVSDIVSDSGTGAEDIDQQILSGEPLDTDGDGLTDVQESELKTNYLDWDSDKDELGDGEEVLIWKT